MVPGSFGPAIEGGIEGIEKMTVYKVGARVWDKRSALQATIVAVEDTGTAYAVSHGEGLEPVERRADELSDPAIYAADLQTATDGLAALARNEADIQEIFADAKGASLTPIVTAQFLMETLPFPEEVFALPAKQFWIEVGAHMGPDWLESLRKTCAFMIKAGEF